MEDNKTLVEGETQYKDSQNDFNSDITCDRSTKKKGNSKPTLPFILDKINNDGRSFFNDPRYDVSNLMRDLIPCFILICNCLIIKH